MGPVSQEIIPANIVHRQNTVSTPARKACFSGVKLPRVSSYPNISWIGPTFWLLLFPIWFDTHGAKEYKNRCRKQHYVLHGELTTQESFIPGTHHFWNELIWFYSFLVFPQEDKMTTVISSLNDCGDEWFSISFSNQSIRKSTHSISALLKSSYYK